MSNEIIRPPVELTEALYLKKITPSVLSTLRMVMQVERAPSEISLCKIDHDRLCALQTNHPFHACTAADLCVMLLGYRRYVLIPITAHHPKAYLM